MARAWQTLARPGSEFRFIIDCVANIILALGANLGEPEQAFRRALDSLADDHQLVATSRLFRTRPVGPPQPEFLNMAAILDVACPLVGFLERCLRLEAEAGRERENEARWGPRVLDLDLCLARGVIHRGPLLVLPHPRLHERSFVLAPAAEIAPDWIHPHLGQTLAGLARKAEERDPDAILGVEAFSMHGAH